MVVSSFTSGSIVPKKDSVALHKGKKEAEHHSRRRRKRGGGRAKNLVAVEYDKMRPSHTPTLFQELLHVHIAVWLPHLAFPEDAPDPARLSHLLDLPAASCQKDAKEGDVVGRKDARRPKKCRRVLRRRAFRRPKSRIPGGLVCRAQQCRYPRVPSVGGLVPQRRCCPQRSRQGGQSGP